MFPLLWLILFILTACALFMMMSCLHFSSKTTPPSSFNTPVKSNNHIWKW